MYRRIMAAVDGSDNSLTAATRAALLAQTHGAQLILLHVTPHQPVPDELKHYAQTEHLTAGHGNIWESVSSELLRRTRDYVTSIAPQTQEVRVERRHGEVAHQIRTAANDFAADMVAVGSRGLNRVSGLVLGSVSQKLAAADMPVDVLIVK